MFPVSQKMEHTEERNATSVTAKKETVYTSPSFVDWKKVLQNGFLSYPLNWKPFSGHEVAAQKSVGSATFTCDVVLQADITLEAIDIHKWTRQGTE